MGSSLSARPMSVSSRFTLSISSSVRSSRLRRRLRACSVTKLIDLQLQGFGISVCVFWIRNTIRKVTMQLFAAAQQLASHMKYDGVHYPSRRALAQHLAATRGGEVGTRKGQAPRPPRAREPAAAHHLPPGTQPAAPSASRRTSAVGHTERFWQA